MSNNEDLLKNIGNNPNPTNMKKILIYVAIAFLVFVIGIIGFAVVQNGRNNQKDAIIPPDNNKNVAKNNNNNNLFKQIPIENANNQNNSAIANNPQNQESKENIKAQVLKNSQNEANNQNQPSKPLNQNITQNQSTKPKEEKEVVKVQTPKESKKVKKVSKKEPEVFIPTAKKSVVKKEKPKKQIIKNKYYIQVAALLRYKKPSKKFLKLIEKNGYKYKFLETYTKIKNEKVKVTKILIGPFSNRLEAKKALKKVKAKITQNAFIFKVK